MGRKGRQRPRSDKAIAHDKFPIGLLSARRRLQNEEYLAKSKVLKEKRKELKSLKK
jgi:hypothetical protein